MYLTSVHYWAQGPILDVVGSKQRSKTSIMSFKSLHGQWVLRVLRSIKLEKENIWGENRDDADVFAALMHTQIEELTSNLPQLQALSSSTSSVDSMVSSETASPPSKRKVATKIQGNAKKALLKWVQYTVTK